MISFEFRAHPMMFFKMIKPYLFVLFLPFIRALVQYITIGKTKGTIFLELLAIAFVSTAAFYGWRSVKINIKNAQLIIEKGFFIKSRSVIALSRISSISTRQSVFDRVTNGVTCSINTEAGRPRKHDFDLKLYGEDAEILLLLVYGDEDKKIIRFSPVGVALLAASTSSAVTGAIIAVPIINNVGRLINVATSDILKEISAAAQGLDSLFPPIVNAITLIFLFAYTVSFLASFFKTLKFKLKVSKSCVEIHSGLITRKKTAFRKAMVNNICFEQTLLMRMFKKYSMKASIGGYGNSKGESATIVPLARKKVLYKQIKALFNLPNYSKQIVPKKNKATLNRFLFTAMMIFCAIVLTAALLSHFFHDFVRFIWFFAIISLCVDAYYASVCYRNYKFGGCCFSDSIMVAGSKGFTIRELYCNKDKVGIIKIYQTPADRYFNTCKLKIIVRSESADNVKLKNIDLQATVSGINDIYKTNINV